MTDFIVKIIEVLVWPGTAIIAVYILRNPIIELIPQLQRLKYKDLEIEFKQKLEALEKKTRESRPKALTYPPPTKEENDYYLQKVEELSPRSAILESWIALESTAISTCQHFKLIPENQRIYFPIAMKILKENNILSDVDIANITDLRTLRNKAAHEFSFNVSVEEAAKFMEIARNIGETIAGEAFNKYGGCSH